MSPEEIKATYPYLECMFGSVQEHQGVIFLMEKFGEQCFNAARETESTTTGDIDDVPGVTIKSKYVDFNDYLKQL